jgi:hypothetical protein
VPNDEHRIDGEEGEQYFMARTTEAGDKTKETEGTLKSREWKPPFRDEPWAAKSAKNCG